MCWEDIEIARSTSRAPNTVLISNVTPTLLAPRNYNRFSIVFSNPGSNSVVISPIQPGGLSSGILLPVNGIAISFNLTDYGALVWDEWWALSSTAPVFVTYIETILNAQCPSNLPLVQ